LQAFGLSVGSWGLANVLQCAVGLSKGIFLSYILSNQPKPFIGAGFNLAANETGYEMLVDLRSDFLSARYEICKGDKPD